MMICPLSDAAIIGPTGPLIGPPVDEAPPPASASDDVDILARTIYGEARGELVAGKVAVACVILNRVRRARARSGRYWWGATVRDVCLRAWQFSCWNVNDPNRAKIETVGPDNRNFQTCLRVARRAIAGTLRDTTHGATHYHNRAVNPPWARGRAPVSEIGGHLFYNNIE